MSSPTKTPVSLAALAADIGHDKTIVFVSGNFNVIHSGHVRLLRFAREQGSVLVVGVNPDTSPGVSVPIDLRLEGVLANKYVDHAIPIRDDISTVISALRPDIVVKGREHESRHNPEQAALDLYGGTLLFSSGDMALSSVSTFDEGPAQKQDRLPADYLQRHDLSRDDLLATLKRVAGLNVIVIGDLIIDEYIDCNPLGMSQEDPTIVVSPISEKRFLGGAGIVAAHARGLGANVTLLCVAGIDDAAETAEQKLSEYDVDHVLLEDKSRPTTLKKRYRALGKTLLRVSHLRQHAISEGLGKKILATIASRIDDTQLILFSDFNYGCLPTRLVHDISELARRHGVMMAADSQASSQLADISRFGGMNLITPTELEARLALKDKSSSLAVLSQNLQDAASAEQVIITLGSEGMLIQGPKDGSMTTDRLPALNGSPRDVAGAGDSLFCLTSLALAAGADIWCSSLLGALSASCQVSRVGNTPLAQDDIIRALQDHE